MHLYLQKNISKEERDMFMLTKNWLMVPQFLYYIILFGGGLFALASAGLIIYGAVKKKSWRYTFRWGIVLAIGVLCVALTITQKIVGHMMVGG